MSAVVLAIITLTECKKGENDPLISLRTRSSRLAGDWECKSMIRTDSTSVGQISISTLIDNSFSIEFPNSNEQDRVGTGSLSYSFDKEGAYSEEVVTDVSYESGEYRFEYTEDKKIKGAWYWLGENEKGGVKNKEIAILQETSADVTISFRKVHMDSNIATDSSITSYNRSYTGTLAPLTYINFDKLTSKEIVIKSSGIITEEDGETTYNILEATYEKSE